MVKAHDPDTHLAERIRRDLKAMMDEISARRKEEECAGMVWVMLSLQLASTAHLAEMLSGK